MKLHLGCGNNYKNGWLNVDIDSSVRTDLYFDVGKKFPLKSNQFETVYACMVFEHLQTPKERINFLNEIYRILKVGGKATIIVPHFSSPNNFQDLTHGFVFGSQALNFLEDKFVVEKQVKFNYVFDGLGLSSWFNKRVSFYEHYLAFTFQASELWFILTKKRGIIR